MTKVTQLSVEQGGELERRRIHLREISGNADAPLETVGQDLRAARLRRGEDLATAARVLKIRRDHLDALEEDRLAALPGRTYAVGFVRAYADYLGLDPLETVERFKSEIAGREDSSSKTAGFPERQDETRLPHGWILIAAIVLGLVAYGLYHLAMTADSAARQPVAAVPDQMMAKPKAKIAHPPAPRSLAAQPSPSAPQPPAQAASTQPTGTGTSSPASGPAVAASQPQTSSAQPTEAAPGTGHIYGQQNGDAHVVLRVKQATRILVQSEDGKVFINRALEPGDAYQVPNLPGLLLTAQHGNAVEIDLDGQAMGLAGKSGDLSDALSLDPQAIADRYGNGRSG